MAASWRCQTARSTCARAWLGSPLRWALTTAALAFMVVWLVARVQVDRSGDGPPAAVDRRAVLALVALALALRVPLAWWDPGISDIPRSTEVAARQLLNGHNPYVERNSPSVIDRYQYPAGTLLVHTPLVAIVPRSVFGEEHVGARATLWVTEAVAVW